MIESKVINYFFLPFVLLFNWSIFRENFELDYILGVKILLSLVMPLIGIIIVFLIKLKNNYLLNYFILSLFIFFFIDQNILSLKFLIFSKINLVSIFFFVFLSVLVFIIFYFKFLNFFFSRFVFFFIIIQFATGVYYFVERNYINDNIDNFTKENLFLNKSNKNGLIILFLDEIDALEELAKRDIYSQNIASNVYKILNKYNFKYGKNIYSSFSDTKMVHAGLLNNLDPLIFNKESDYEFLFKRRYKYISIKKNLLFDSWNGDINVYQSEAVNFCNHHKVKNCTTNRSTTLRELIYHLYKTDSLIKFLFVKIIYYTDDIFLKTNRELFIKYYQAPDKSNFKKNLDHILNKIKFTKDFSHNGLFYYHALTPHGPYSFKKDCRHDYVNQKNMSINEREAQHALEINCVFRSIDIFLEELNNENLLNKYDIIVLGDHGSRISKSISHSHKTFFAIKTENIIDENILNNNTIQNIFLRTINPDYKILFDKIIIPDASNGKSIPLPF